MTWPSGPWNWLRREVWPCQGWHLVGVTSLVLLFFQPFLWSHILAVPMQSSVYTWSMYQCHYSQKLRYKFEFKLEYISWLYDVCMMSTQWLVEIYITEHPIAGQDEWKSKCFKVEQMSTMSYTIHGRLRDLPCSMFSGLTTKLLRKTINGWYCLDDKKYWICRGWRNATEYIDTHIGFR